MVGSLIGGLEKICEAGSMVPRSLDCGVKATAGWLSEMGRNRK